MEGTRVGIEKLQEAEMDVCTDRPASYFNSSCKDTKPSALFKLTAVHRSSKVHIIKLCRILKCCKKYS